MIKYHDYTLSNGLRLLVHEDHNSPMAALNIVYNVGSRDENEKRTGFAHLFEHLMFGGSKNIPDYDTHVQGVGGENNAFTSPDITNYYITLPAENLETALWLESDRMLSLSFDPKVLEVQRKVVVEEFKQNYLNQPYGDIWLKLRPLAYDVHPYRWATIGRDISQIENTQMPEVKGFFQTYYHPANAVMVVAGDVDPKDVLEKVEKWFGEIPGRGAPVRNIAKEPVQRKERFLETSAKVPLNALIKAWHMPGRYDFNFFECDLLGDVLGRGKSSRMYRKLVREKPIFSNLGVAITSSLDPGLLVFRGFVTPEFSLEDANEAVEQIIDELMREGVSDVELNKVKNQSESSFVFAEVELLTRAMNLAYAANAGNPEWVNEDVQKLREVSAESMLETSKNVFSKANCSTIFYRATL